MGWSKQRTRVLETLPDAVLLVLASWLNVYQLWTLANTCCDMRQRLLKFPALWSSFKIADASYEGPHDAIGRAIGRIASRPPARLSIFGAADVYSGSFIGLISDWVSTLEVLRARFHMELSDSVDHQQFAAVTDALARPAPNLDTFEIPPGLLVSEVYDLPTSCLGATAGRLRRCGLANIRLDLSAPGLYPALSTLTTFKLVKNGTADHSIDASHLQTLLGSLAGKLRPHVQEVHCDCGWQHAIDPTTAAPADKMFL